MPKETHLYRNSFDILLAPYSSNVAVSGDSNSDTSRFMSPLKIFEYMSSCKPIVASDLTVLKEILNSNNSLLVNPDDENEWVCAILKLHDKNERYKISRQAYLDFQNYTWTNRALYLTENIFNQYLSKL